jgi:hypothetical protein
VARPDQFSYELTINNGDQTSTHRWEEAQSPRRYLPRRARHLVIPHHTYTLTAGVGDEPMWTATIDHADPAVHDTLDDAVGALLEHHAPFAAA